RPIITKILRWFATGFFLVAGAMHFVIPEFYLAMMPPFIPFQSFFVIITGIAEMAGAVALQVPKLRRTSGILMIVMLVAIFPANIYVAWAQPVLPNVSYTPASMWWRLLLQPVFIAWIWRVSLLKDHILDNIRQPIPNA
ncbi:MAG: DoxX family protein, partial [Bacteroidota bacterium]